MYFDSRLPVDLVDALWQHPDRVLASGQPLRKVGARSTVLLEWNAQAFVIKHYVALSRRHALKKTFP
jgi:hypothetical protein